MDSQINLRQIQRRAYLAYHEDGLVDVFVGLVFLLYGAVMLAGKTAFIGLCWMPALFIVPVKKWLTVPRMGYVKYRPSGNVLWTKIGIMAMIAGMLFFLLFVYKNRSPGLRAFIDAYFLLIFGIFLASLPLAGAVALGVRRFYAYAALILVLFTAANFQDYPLPVIFVILGSLLLLTGLVVLVRFLRKYPKPTKEVSNGT